MDREHICQYSEARYRLRGNRYGWRSNDHTRDSDRLVMFTVESRAREESDANLAYLQDLAKRNRARYLCINDHKIQFLGRGRLDDVKYDIKNSEWYHDAHRVEDHWRRPVIETDTTDHSECISVRYHRHNFVIPEHQGVHDLATEKRVRNREHIIRTFWDYGFATWRGRPPTVASIRWSGNREELEELTELAQRHGPRHHHSDVAKKIYSAYRGINRYAAWPGSW